MERASLLSFAIACLGFLMAVGIAIRTRTLESNAYRLREQVRQLYKQAGIEFEPGVDKQIQALVRSGKKIQAIKLYRELTGRGLKESKDAVEAMMRGEDAPGL